jgi:hypothetical protein
MLIQILIKQFQNHRLTAYVLQELVQEYSNKEKKINVFICLH